MKKVKLLKTLLIPTLGITAIGAIAAVSTSCSSSDVPVTSYICVASNADSTLELINESVYNPDLQYSIDGSHWVTYSETLNIPANREIYLRGNNKNYWSLSEQIYSHFSITGNVSISGNVMSLLDNGTGAISSIPNDYCFYKLFIGSTGITMVSEDFLPATTLANHCYYSMFKCCSSLTTAPDLPATTLADHCYSQMFYECTSLTTAPDLPATTLADRCYYDMFHACTSLTSAPETLPATSLVDGCYQGVFADCTSLTTAPQLPATQLTDYCYDCMFYGCTSLTTAPDLPATKLATACYNWMFLGCTLLNSVRISYAGTAAEAPNGAFTSWVTGVAATGTFYYNGPSSVQDFGFSSNWIKEPFNTKDYQTIFIKQA